MLFIIKQFINVDICKQKWQNDLNVGYKTPFDLLRLIEMEVSPMEGL
jgi:hypothetical protein